MMFTDTSVMVCGSTPSDPRHDACVKALTFAESHGMACSIHSLAETFSILSGRPHPLKVPPAIASQIVRHASKRFKVITLTAAEHLVAIDSLQALGHSGGMVYDALLLACARKIRAKRIYTLNLKHFRLIAPDLASRIVEP
jgi:predicted nucleic acid-binding protein